MHRSIFSSITLGLGLTVAFTLGGCWSPGGTRGWSPDSYTIESSSMIPQTWSLKDTRTGETLFSYDIPVGRQLVVKFHKNHTPEDAAYPDLMKWDDWEIGTRFGSPEKELAVPPASARLIEVSVRKSPELPEAMRTGATTNAATPTNATTPVNPGGPLSPTNTPATPIAPSGAEPVY